ncbi:zinc-binding alcohol dehydrogenase family protein [Liquorilactobacillus oeni]|uniref:Zinc-type alcohol dehydrogenase-like protein n=1 Tax=Liquorilactobacillus oeni DSM 19972 TaxID=1423777 RepID=A0A0R1MKM5_9LACO|nr:zinc-binding alcohol dehydrogenase family protein [Liquorilactobacillus oeni]KRL04488.1 NADPH quinone reductase related Zn-dependent oxidoreductase [Liquorilactobacillus oeni DSM 19972]
MDETMKAIGFLQNLPIADEKSLFEFETKKPKATGHDLLVKIEAIAVNPIDVSIRKSATKKLKNPRIIGWDALGVVEGCGEEATLFKRGERVFYAGAVNRPGCNADYQLVDERLVGHAPQKLSIVQSAAMPLTSLTAWESLFEKLGINPDAQINKGKTILIINGAGGVGSIATQLAHWAGLQVIATASRPETVKWTLEHGADEVLNHHKNLTEELRKAGHQSVDYILGLNDIDGHWKEMAEMIKPQGKIVSITGNKQPLDLGLLKPKSATFSWEWMYTKSFYQLSNMITQHETLEKISALLDEGVLKSTVTKVFEPLNAANLRQAHKMIETNRTIGKIVIRK